MRPLILLLLLAGLSACVSSGKYKRTLAEFGQRESVRDSLMTLRADSMHALRLALERQRGSNDALLVTQDRLQDRLLAQDDEIESLQGNFSSTSGQLRRQLNDAEAGRAKAEANRDSVLRVQQDAILDFQNRLDDISSQLVDSLEGRLAPGSYFVSNRSGEVILSIQEDVLFRRNSSTSLETGSAYVLSRVAEVLQRDPLLKLSVAGHTDNAYRVRSGVDAWEFGALRAATLAEELYRGHNLSPNRIMACSQGEFGPIRSNSTEEGRRFNRRVDFVFVNNVGNLTRALNKLLPKRED